LRIKQKNNSRKINYLIIGFIFLFIGSILFIFIRHRLILKKIEPPPPPENTEANLTIKNFHHVATENGIKKWTLDAAAASLYTSANTVKLDDISVIFFMNDHQDITLKAKTGELNSQTNNMALKGDIVAEMPPYRLTTQNLNYDHQSRIIRSDTPVIITGTSVLLKADTMSYEMDSKIIKCNGNVEGSFIETRN